MLKGFNEFEYIYCNNNLYDINDDYYTYNDRNSKHTYFHDYI